MSDMLPLPPGVITVERVDVTAIRKSTEYLCRALKRESKALDLLWMHFKVVFIEIATLRN